MAALTAAETERRVAAIRKYWPRAPLARIAASLDLRPGTFQRWVADNGGPEAILAGGADGPLDAVPPLAAPVEVHDAQYWRRKAQAAEREIGRLHRVCEELGGVRQVPVTIPDWTRPDAGPRSPAVLIVHTSDWHMGEVILPNGIAGVNEFNPTICRERLERLTHTACEMGERWMADKEPAGVLLTLAGDLISGDIHEELTATNALTSPQQVQEAASVACGMIRTLADTFGRVDVVGVPGNHGRTTRKPTAKLYGALSYDILICSIVAERLADDDRITWQVDGATDQFVPLFGWRVMVTHGDKLGTGGGQGFVGPVLPMMRGVHKTLAQQAALDARPDLVLAGHYHTSAALPRALFNGSIPGYSEFGRDIRGGVEPPKQWVALMTPRWVLRERCDVVLAEPPRANIKPRVRIVDGKMVPA